MQTTKVQPQIGWRVDVYCPQLWSGPQPGVIVGLGKPEGEPLNRYDLSPDGSPTTEQADARLVNVNVFIDGDRFQSALDYFRAVSDRGNTLARVPIFDALSDEQRTEVGNALEPNHPDADPYHMRAVWAELPDLRGAVRGGIDKIIGLAGQAFKAGVDSTAKASSVCTCGRDYVNDDEHKPDCGTQVQAEGSAATQG